MKTYWIVRKGERVTHYQDMYEAYRSIEAWESLEPDTEFILEVVES